MRQLILLLFSFIFCHYSYSQNSALIFDGQSEYITAPDDPAHDIGDGFTVEAWILADEWKQNKWEGSIVNKDAHGTGVVRGYAFRCGENGTLSFVVGTDDDWQEAFSGQVMNANQWHHVAAVVDNGAVLLYIDGQPVASHVYDGNEVESEMPLHIGASPGFGGRNFSGVIDEVRIWDVARSQVELNDNMTVDLTGSEANLVAYYPMNEGMGMIVGDMSPTGIAAQTVDMDDTNWVDGYTLPDFDVSVQDVYGIDVVNMQTRPVKLFTNIQNSGLESISDVELSVYIDEGFVFSEMISSTIMSGELIAHEFTVPIDLTGTSLAEVEVRASHPDDENSLNNSGVIKVVSGANNRIIVSNNEQHNFGSAGQVNHNLITLPGDLHKYEQILLHLSLNCPTTGCDPWDQYGNIKINTPSGIYELARFVTPYGISCGGWVVDITDFKSVLTGQVEFQNFIQVWGNSGWLLDAQIELIDNNQNDIYSNISPLWEDDYLVYGDPGISHDLDEVTLGVDGNTQNSHVRMTITGHGQGNTNNAAEFFEVTHELEIDASVFDNHHLWKADCADNVCSDQNGTWLFPRAGWCPGQEVTPYIINTSSVANAGGDTDFDYVLQDYTNLLNTGYNNSGHTEPHYKIYSYFVETSSSPYVDYRNLMAESITGNLNGDVFEAAIVSVTNNGFEDIDNFTVNIFNNNELVASESFTENIAVDASVQKEITVGSSINLNVGNKIYGEVVANVDDNPGDNVTKTDLTSDVEDVFSENGFEVYPNPTSTGELFIKYSPIWEGSTLHLFSTGGKLIQSVVVSNKSESLHLGEKGMYWYTIVHPNGQQASGKIAFVK